MKWRDLTPEQRAEAAAAGVTRNAFEVRIARDWSVAEALHVPARPRGISIAARVDQVDPARTSGIPERVIYERLRRGASPEAALAPYVPRHGAHAKAAREARELAYVLEVERREQRSKTRAA